MERALKRDSTRAASIPRITLVILNAVFVQELAVLFLEGAAAMVFFLGLYIFEEGVELAWLGLTENAP